MDFKCPDILLNNMEILVIGDTHVPNRAKWLPKKIDDFISSKRFDLVMCTGDLTDRKVLDYLKNLSDRVVVVSGNMDHLPLPEQQTVKVENLKFGIIHGHQVYPRGDIAQLKEIAYELGVDVLIHGHTHSADIYFKDVLLLNPGSATGVWSGGRASLIPSFMTAKVEKSEIDVELFELKKGELRVTRRSFEL